MQVKSVAECSVAILSTCTKLPPVFKTFVWSFSEWLLNTGFTVDGFGKSIAESGGKRQNI